MIMNLNLNLNKIKSVQWLFITCILTKESGDHKYQKFLHDIQRNFFHNNHKMKKIIYNDLLVCYISFVSVNTKGVYLGWRENWN